jgi:hypothetical protein
MAPAIELPPFDATFGVHVLFVSIPRHEAVYLTVLLESYEGLVSFRTQAPEHEPGRALLAVLIPPDFARDAVAVLEGAVETAGLTQHSPAPDDWIALRVALEVEDERAG